MTSCAGRPLWAVTHVNPPTASDRCGGRGAGSMGPVVVGCWRSRSGGRRADAHAARADASTAGHRGARRRGEPTPSRTSSSPTTLRRQAAPWHPGAGVGCGCRGHDRARLAVLRRGATRRPRVDDATPCSRSGATVDFVGGCSATPAGRRSSGCFGLHEWAMVYRQSTTCGTPAAAAARRGRHRRRGRGHQLRCSHFDAFRFFTPAGRAAQPADARRATAAAELEQPGCLHAGMDLYKWAYKLAPARARRTAARLLSSWPATSASSTCAPRPTTSGPRVRAGADRDARRKSRIRRRPAGFRRPGWGAAHAAARRPRRPQ